MPRFVDKLRKNIDPKEIECFTIVVYFNEIQKDFQCFMIGVYSLFMVK